MARVTSYNSFEEMQADIDRAVRAADVRVRPWQENIAVGDLILTVAEDEPVFSEVLEKYDEPRLRHYRFCRAFSVFVDPERGELGDIHVVSAVAVLSREQFEEARAAGWRFPSESKGGAA